MKGPTETQGFGMSFAEAEEGDDMEGDEEEEEATFKRRVAEEEESSHWKLTARFVEKNLEAMGKKGKAMLNSEDSDEDEEDTQMTRTQMIVARAARERHAQAPKALYQPKKQRWLERQDFKDICGDAIGRMCLNALEKTPTQRTPLECTKIKEWVGHIGFFKGLPGAMKDMLTKQLKLERVKQGTIIYRQSELGTCMYMVHRGHVLLHQSKMSKQE